MRKRQRSEPCAHQLNSHKPACNLHPQLRHLHNMSNVVVTGITTGIQPQDPVSSLPQRLEWHQFVQNIDYVTLYVEALQLFMNLEQSETLSYFQIGGSSPYFLI
jgi:hypothetical protein